jgi:hypothetical protein
MIFVKFLPLISSFTDSIYAQQQHFKLQTVFYPENRTYELFPEFSRK